MVLSVIVVLGRLRYRTPGQFSEMYLIDSSCIKTEGKNLIKVSQVLLFPIVSIISLIDPKKVYTALGLFIFFAISCKSNYIEGGSFLEAPLLPPFPFFGNKVPFHHNDTSLKFEPL